MRSQVLAKTVVFNSDGKLLVLRRSDDDVHRPGGLDFPGGKIEGGESIAAGASRELAEESGLHITTKEMFLVFADSHVERNNQEHGEVNVVWLGFIAKLSDNQDVQLSHEHKHFDWLTFEEALAQHETPTQKLFLNYIRDNKLFDEI
jgi:8-oxo-dGTP pyrophosphatase MutT (NUDIX family)